MPDAPPRPPSLTMACLFVAIACLMVLFELMTVLSSWTSLDVQDALRDALRDPLVRDLGVSTDRMVEILRVAAYGLLVVAIAGLVFSIYAMRGHRASRVILTVLCGFGFLVFAATGVAGILPAALLLASGFILWSRDARRWYALKNGLPTPSLPTAPRPDPFAARSGDAAGPPQPSAAPFAPVHPTVVHPAAAHVSAAPRRPGAINAAGIIVLVASGLSIAAGLLFVMYATVGRDVYRQVYEDNDFARRALKDSGWTFDQMLQLMLGMGIAGVVFGVAGAAVSIPLLRGAKAGWIATIAFAGLVVVASVPLLIFAIGVVSGPFGAVVLYLLLKKDVRDWFTRRASPPPTRG